MTMSPEEAKDHKPHVVFVDDAKSFDSTYIFLYFNLSHDFYVLSCIT